MHSAASSKIMIACNILQRVRAVFQLLAAAQYSYAFRPYLRQDGEVLNTGRHYGYGEQSSSATELPVASQDARRPTRTHGMVWVFLLRSTTPMAIRSMAVPCTSGKH